MKCSNWNASSLPIEEIEMRLARLLAATALGFALWNVSARADQTCEVEMAEIRGALERTRLDDYTQTQLKPVLAAGEAARAAGNSAACLEATRQLKSILHLDH